MVQTPSGEWDYVGDDQILQLLEENRLSFEAGEKSQLILCVVRCARFQAVIPEWAANALIAISDNLESGRLKDFNDAFGMPTEKVNTRAAKARINKLKTEVLAHIQQLRIQGTSFNDADMFSQVVDALRERGIHANHRDVQYIYKTYGSFLKKLPRGPLPNGDGTGFAMVTFPKPRRHGRKILRD